MIYEDIDKIMMEEVEAFLAGDKSAREGERYHEEGEKQIHEYMEYYHLDIGYMLNFNFNKKKEPGVKRVEFDGKVLFEATV